MRAVWEQWGVWELMAARCDMAVVVTMKWGRGDQVAMFDIVALWV